MNQDERIAPWYRQNIFLMIRRDVWEATPHLATLPLVSSTTALARTQAIVLLSGGLYARAPEYGGEDTISPTTLFRARYAARLHRLGGHCARG